MFYCRASKSPMINKPNFRCDFLDMPAFQNNSAGAAGQRTTTLLPIPADQTCQFTQPSISAELPVGQPRSKRQ